MGQRSEKISHQIRYADGNNMKRCSTSFVLRELLIKMTVRYHYTKIQKFMIPTLVKRWCNRNSFLLLIENQNGTATLEDSLSVSYKTKQNYTYDHIPRYLLSWFGSLCPDKICRWIFIAALFTIAQNWKQPVCSSKVNG